MDVACSSASTAADSGNRQAPFNRHGGEIRDIRQCAAAPRAYNCSPTFERPDQLAAAFKEKPGA